MRTFAMSLAAHPCADECSDRPHGRCRAPRERSTGARTTCASPDWGKAGTPYRRIAAASLCGRDREAGRRAADVVTSATASSTTSARTSSPRTASASGDSSGASSSTTRSGCARTRPASRCRSRSTPTDPLEAFRNDFGAIAFAPHARRARERARPSPRQQINTVSSYIDGSTVYGDDAARLEWLRDGPSTATWRTTAPRCCCRTGYCRAATPAATPPPRRRWRSTGRLLAAPADAMVAGDVRANENVALTATQTLFAREHNRIVDALPTRLPEEEQVPDRPAGRRRGAAVHHLPASSCPRSASTWRRTAATTRAWTRRCRTSSRPSATARTA